MNTNDLKLFEAVAFHGNFTKAADAMYTVQSNVTARIKSLEQEFGATLILRTPRKAELTPAGKTVLECCKQIHNLIEATKFSIGKDTAIKGCVRIGFTETTMALRGPSLVAELADQFPLIDLNLTSAMPEKLLEGVLNFKLDAAFVPAPVYNQELEQIPIMDESLVAVAHAGVKDLDELLKQPKLRAIVFDQGCYFRARLEAWLVSNNISDYHKTAMNSIEGVVNFIESGIGFSFLPSEIITTFYGQRKLKTFALPAATGSMKTVLIYRKDNVSSPVLQAFLSLFTDTAGTFPLKI